MATELEKCITEEQRSIVCFCRQKGSIESTFIKKLFLFAVGSSCHVRGSQLDPLRNLLGSKRFADDEEVETEVRKWLRQQSRDFYAAGFRRTGKAMGQVYQCWWRICREINVFPKFEYHKFYFLYSFVTYLLTPSYSHQHE
jgi:hypothetical protein